MSRLTGEFVLRSGRIANEYFDKYQFEADPALLDQLAERMAVLIPEGTEVLAGLEMGGIAVVTALARHARLPTAFVRKQAKQYGTARLAEGAEVAGRRVRWSRTWSPRAARWSSRPASCASSGRTSTTRSA